MKVGWTTSKNAKNTYALLKAKEDKKPPSN
jgi:hypothetical protein